MPTYSFKCHSCNTHEDRALKMLELDNQTQVCYNCYKKLERVMTTFSAVCKNPLSTRVGRGNR